MGLLQEKISILSFYGSFIIFSNNELPDTAARLSHFN